MAHPNRWPLICAVVVVLAAGCRGPARRVPADPMDNDYTALYEASRPFVVHISGASGQPLGCGLVIDRNGYILTNSHVVKAKGEKTARLPDGVVRPFRVIAANVLMDLAVVKVDAGRALTPAPLSAETDVLRGETVIAFRNTASGRPFLVGVVSGTNRVCGYEWGGGLSHHPGLIQADVRATDGDYGGPLVNALGEVVGLLSGSMRHTDGIKFAIPPARLLEALPKLLDVEGPRGFVLGAAVDPLGPAKVTRVSKGSPAEKAGLRAGDTVTHVNGKPVRIGLDLYDQLCARRGGQTLHLKLRRSGKAHGVAVTLRAITPQPAMQVAGLLEGLRVEHYKGRWNKLPDFGSLKPAKTGVAQAVELGEYDKTNEFGLRFTGFIRAPADGVYAFHIASDDGSKLVIGGRLVIDNDGPHGHTWATGYIPLKAGLHPIMVTFFERDGHDNLLLCYEGPGLHRRPVPAGVLFHRKP